MKIILLPFRQNSSDVSAKRNQKNSLRLANGKSKIAENLNILGQFCGKRDVEELNQKNLHEKYGIEKADVMILLAVAFLLAVMYWLRLSKMVLQSIILLLVVKDIQRLP